MKLNIDDEEDLLEQIEKKIIEFIDKEFWVRDTYIEAASAILAEDVLGALKRKPEPVSVGEQLDADEKMHR